MYLDNYFFGIAAGALSVIAFTPYVFSIVKGETRPSASSWWTWFLISLITTSSTWYAGATWAVLVLPVWLCFSYLVVSILSVKYGDNNWDLMNKFCVLGALVGAILWWITGEPLVALVISIVADVFASIPNFRHVLKNPEQENRLGWTLGWGTALLELFAVSQWSFGSLAESGWAVYFFLNMTIVLLLLWRASAKKLVL
ncbi:MAG: hypothetical protein EXS46_01045 [Candidatus Taylorbacteria bacterium]|nr:hypothetical protein [Candidatus Taylorbacteria bacterium]